MATATNEQERQWLEDRTKPPFLRRVRIEGYKSIALCDVSLQPLTILVGRNGSGKSNFLDALAFVGETMESSVSEAVRRRGGWSSIACRTTGAQKIVFEVEAGFICGPPIRRVNENTPYEPSEEAVPPNLEGVSFRANYRLELVGGGTTPPTIERELLDLENLATHARVGFKVHRGRVTRGRSTPDATLPISLPHVRNLLAVHRPDRPLLSVIGTQPFIELGEGLRVMGFYNFYPAGMRRLQKPNPGWLLERDGSNLASVIEGLKEIDPESVGRIRDYVAVIAEEVEGFDTVGYGEYETVRFRVRSLNEKHPLEFDAASMSDGTLRALAALVAAFQIVLPHGHPSVIGIEEPETSLHPAAAHALVAALDAATEHAQVLLTTHSGDLLAERAIQPSQVLVVRNKDGQTQIAPVDAASREIIRKELYSLADLQRMDQLDLDEAELAKQAQVPKLNGKE